MHELRTITVQALLADLRREGVRMWVDGARLHYQAPKGVMTEPRLAQIRERKAEIIDFLRHVVAARSHVPPLLPAEPRPAHLPLSYAQERLWLLEQIEALGPAYNIPAGVRLIGTFDAAAFEAALDEIVRRHETLRTRFAVANGGVWQVIDPPGAFRLERFDLSGSAPAAREADAETIARAFATRPFDLERGPPFRAALLRLGDSEHVAVVVMHHIVSDGWSRSILIQEIGATYAALAASRPRRCRRCRASPHCRSSPRCR